ncbi:Uncharacterised protein [Vibrio cholerae]|nr:Uncharacterised protein [Vibrio cholerae]CSI15971.1 Uncharacterised protein [Vibrio cholerae]
MLKYSAKIRRLERNAVSPEVIGRITTPRKAITPPNTPSRPKEAP